MINKCISMIKTDRFSFFLIIMILIASACAGQKNIAKPIKKPSSPSRPAAQEPKKPLPVHDIRALSYTVEGISFSMKLAPGGTFPTGTDDAGRMTVKNPFWLAESEVTYELWYKVAVWARKNGYVFNDQGREGNMGIDGAAPSGTKGMPVTMMTWRDAVVWCNALTEYYNSLNGSEPDLDFVYYTDAAYTSPLKKSVKGAVNMKAGGQDNPYIKAAARGNMSMDKCTAKGFRLPTIAEWECAARWRGTPTGETIFLGNQYWTKGNTFSGSDRPSSDLKASDAVAWYTMNSSISNPGTDTGKRGTHAVKRKKPNTLGLYDMSGNVYEYCFDWHPKAVGNLRIGRGGAYNVEAAYMGCGFIFLMNPWASSEDYGFRIARSEIFQ